jgi:hypothetical protein
MLIVYGFMPLQLGSILLLNSYGSSRQAMTHLLAMAHWQRVWLVLHLAYHKLSLARSQMLQHLAPQPGNRHSIMIHCWAAFSSL